MCLCLCVCSIKNTNKQELYHIQKTQCDSSSVRASWWMYFCWISYITHFTQWWVTQIKESCTLPSTMNHANINLLLKPDKVQFLSSSYCPILLINTDLKIICKALARRLEKILLTLYTLTKFLVPNITTSIPCTELWVWDNAREEDIEYFFVDITHTRIH